MKNIFPFEMYGVKNEVKVKFETYNANNKLAVTLYCKPEDFELHCKDPYQELYGVATVNLHDSESLEPDEQFVDENNLPGITGWLIENGIATPTDKYARSSFCIYQAMKFNIPDEDRQRLHLQ